MKTKNRIVILAESNIVSNMVPTLWGGPLGFTTIKAAEECGLANIKKIKWRVAREVTRTPLSGEPETHYEFLSGVFNNRGGDSYQD